MTSIVLRDFLGQDMIDLQEWDAWKNLMHRFSRDMLSRSGQENTATEGGLQLQALQCNDKEFRINLDMRHFTPEEVKITCENGRITVHAKHEEKEDKHGFVKREISRSFTLPENVDQETATSSMNPNGILSVCIKRKAIEPPTDVKIPVEFKSS